MSDNGYDKLPSFVLKHQGYHLDQFGGDYTAEEVDKDKSTRVKTSSLKLPETNLISSLSNYEAGGKVWHRPLLDLDMEAVLMASSTNKHGHLYIDHLIEHDDYFELLKSLHHVGLVEEGFVARFERSGATFLRMPGIKKGAHA